jgi:hypothetical protein
MTWRDKLELGLKEDPAYRKDARPVPRKSRKANRVRSAPATRKA